MKTIYKILFATFCISTTYGQVGINIDNSAPHGSAMLDVKSTSKAFYPPRMTTGEKTGIMNAQKGAIVFDITLNGLSYYDGFDWRAVDTGFNIPLSKTGLSSGTLFSLENLTATGTGYGITSIINAESGNAISAYALKSAPTGHTVGLAGYNNSSNAFGYGVIGTHSGAGIGVFGSASNLGIGVKGVSQNGIGGFFSGATTSSYALVTDIGNVGIGTLTPTLSGLVVDKAVGNAHAIFGSNTAGLSLESNWPGISFNAYYNAGRKPLSNGFVGGMSMNPANGTLLLYNSATAGTTGTNIVGLERLVINNLGNVGIGTSSPASRLDIQGTTNLSHFYFGSNEDTYIRGGKATSNVIIGDVGNNIGIKTALPYYDLTFKSELGDKISFFGGETSTTSNHYGIGMQGYLLQFFVPSATESLVFGTGRSASFSEKMRITGSGFVGIGINNPSSALGVARGTGLNGTAVFYGTTHSSHFNYYTNEDTYIRGGKDNAKVFINDIGSLGQIQIGNATTPAGFKMSVDGKLICTELEVSVTPWPDYVFAKNYQLKPLPELENYIEKNGHLPNIPKAETIENQSLALGNMAKLQMEKIEELTLYIIEINKRLQRVEEENKELRAGNKIVSTK